MNAISSTSGYALLLAFGITMFAITYIGSRAERWKTQVGFLAAGRQVNWWLGAMSIAVSWIWAPALFVSVQQAYQQGIPGIFWFTFPNILCLFIMAPLALRIRRFLPTGFTQPEWIRFRFDERTHRLYLIPFFWYQLMAVTVQLYAGGSIFAFISGIPIEAVMLVIAGTTLAYAIVSGMRASIITDFLQYVVIVAGGLLIIPWTVLKAGGWNTVLGGLSGLDGTHGSLFDAGVAFNFGIVTTIGLISGVLSDQQHWQRAFTIDIRVLRRSYVWAGILFGIVPIGLSLLGFIAANSATSVSLPTGVDPSMIGLAVITKFLPTWAVGTFAVMLLCGLCSTLDSGLCAASSLYAVNWHRYTDAEQALLGRERSGDTLTQGEVETRIALDRKVIGRGRTAMVGITIAGLLLAFAVIYIPGFGLKYLWWIFNTIAACVAVPTVLSLYWDRLDARGVVRGVLTAFFVGIPVFIYANYIGSATLTVVASVGIVLITVVFSLLFPRRDSWRPNAASASDAEAKK